ncbi:hypothetical protein GCM10017687_26840 [Streptomyces echinatus]
MRDTLLIALYAFAGAAVTGLAGAAALRLLRRRSLTVSLAVVAAVGVGGVLTGTLAVAWAMFLSPHDLTVVTTVVAMAAVVSLVTALILGRWVVARSRELAMAARSFGDGGDFAAPAAPATAELAEVSRELAATSARLAESRERERMTRRGRGCRTSPWCPWVHSASQGTTRPLRFFTWFPLGTLIRPRRPAVQWFCGTAHPSGRRLRCHPADQPQRGAVAPGLGERLGEDLGGLGTGDAVRPVEDEEGHPVRAELGGLPLVGADRVGVGVRVGEHRADGPSSSPAPTASSTRRSSPSVKTDRSSAKLAR